MRERNIALWFGRLGSSLCSSPPPGSWTWSGNQASSCCKPGMLKVHHVFITMCPVDASHLANVCIWIEMRQARCQIRKNVCRVGMVVFVHHHLRRIFRGATLIAIRRLLMFRLTQVCCTHVPAWRPSALCLIPLAAVWKMRWQCFLFCLCAHNQHAQLQFLWTNEKHSVSPPLRWLKLILLHPLTKHDNTFLDILSTSSHQLSQTESAAQWPTATRAKTRRPCAVLCRRQPRLKWCDRRASQAKYKPAPRQNLEAFTSTDHFSRKDQKGVTVVISNRDWGFCIHSCQLWVQYIIRYN